MNPQYTYRDRLGTYYFRLVNTKSGIRTETRLSLKTKDTNTARKRAMKMWLTVNQYSANGYNSPQIINEILRDSIGQMERKIMSENDSEVLRHGPELVNVVDIAGTRDLDSLQDIVAYAHAGGGNIHAPFGAGECTFFTIHDDEHEEPAVYPYEKSYFVSPTVVLTNESIEEAISSQNGYFEFSRFLSYEPGGWKKEHPSDVYLFQVHSNRAKGKPISRHSVSRAFKDAGDRIGLRINTHSMRKSRGYVMFADGVPIEKVSKVLNHSHPAVTMRYLGITNKEVMDSYDEYEL